MRTPSGYEEMIKEISLFCTVWLYVHYYPPGCEIVLPYGRGLDPLDYSTLGGFLLSVSYPHGQEGYLGVGFSFRLAVNAWNARGDFFIKEEEHYGKEN